MIEAQVKDVRQGARREDQGGRGPGQRRARSRLRRPSTRRSTPVRNRTEWDERTKEIQLANLQAVAQRRLDVKKQIIEDKKLERDPRGQGRIGAEDPRHPEQRPVRGRRAFRRCLRSSWA